MPDDDLTRLPDEGSKAHLLSAGQAFGQYEVIRLLGRGGMGEAYEVAHPVLEKRFVLKLLSPEIMSRPDAAERFKREAKVMARLEHPNIVKVDDFGETDGLTWLRMELMAGWQHGGKSHQSLQSLIKECAPLPESLVTQLVGQILKGLGEAHGKGAIHRDIKPSNILLQHNGLKPNGFQAKIADFGLVQMVGEDWLQSQVQLTVARSMAHSAGSGQADPDATRLDDEGRMADGGSTHSAGSGEVGTSTQALLGTYAYMSPEQKKGSQVDVRSDLFSVALIAFQMLTGEESLGMETPGELVDGLDPAWDGWIKRGIATRLDRRFQDAGQMLHKLPGYSAGSKSQATVIPSAKDKPKPEPESLPGTMSGGPVESGKDFELKLGECSLKMKWIPPGKFMMGSPEGEEGRRDDERQHEVILSEGYWLGATQVTQAFWENLMGSKPSKFRGTKLPVESVSWEDAMAFCQKLTKLAQNAGALSVDLNYTLPSEAQWEYACRAGTSGAYAGDLDTMGWYGEPQIRGGKTHPVGQKRANAWGLYDMHGNVCEWCLDWYGDYPTVSVVDPKGARSGSWRVSRGGSSILSSWDCRSADRRRGPETGLSSLGFRLALVPTQRYDRISSPSETVSPSPIESGKDFELKFGDSTLNMKRIAPGKFMMGSPEEIARDGLLGLVGLIKQPGEYGRQNDEMQHQVTLTQAYWLGETQITQSHWQSVMKNNPSKFKGADLPVEEVSWEDAMEFCRKLTDDECSAGRLPEDFSYTLPTEAQWEYACRAGTTGAYAGELDTMGWYDENSGNKTHPVGQKRPNAWGLYDMHGNLYEWCLDWYGDYPSGSVVNPTGASSGSRRVFRGGCWSCPGWGCRSAFRYGVSLSTTPHFSRLGFRLALVPTR